MCVKLKPPRATQILNRAPAASRGSKGGSLKLAWRRPKILPTVAPLASSHTIDAPPICYRQPTVAPAPDPTHTWAGLQASPCCCRCCCRESLWRAVALDAPTAANQNLKSPLARSPRARLCASAASVSKTILAVRPVDWLSTDRQTDKKVDFGAKTSRGAAAAAAAAATNRSP